MGDLPLIPCKQGKNLHLFLCRCRTVVALKETLLIRDFTPPNLFFRSMFNVQLSDNPEKIGYETKQITCEKCGVHLGFQTVKPPLPPYTKPSIVFRVNLYSLLEWDGNKLIDPRPYALPVEGIPATIVDFQYEPADVVNKQDSTELAADEKHDVCYVFYECGYLSFEKDEPDDVDDATVYYDMDTICGFKTDP